MRRYIGIVATPIFLAGIAFGLATEAVPGNQIMRKLGPVLGKLGKQGDEIVEGAAKIVDKTEEAATAAGKGATALSELKRLPPMTGMKKDEIANLLKSEGYSSVPAKNGGTVWTKSLPDGNTAVVRIDPPNNKLPPQGYADEVAHVHKEIVPTANVKDGNFTPGKNVITLDDACCPTKDPVKTHIPIEE